MAMVFRNQYKIQTIFAENFSTFESQCVLIESPTTPLLCVLVYRPPKPDKDFIKEFSDFISHIITLYDHLLILGDFNIHVCCPGKPMVTEFTHVLDSFGFIQHVDKATHVLGHTLDLVMSYGFPLIILVLKMLLSQIISLLFSMSYYQVLHVLLKYRCLFSLY